MSSSSSTTRLTPFHPSDAHPHDLKNPRTPTTTSTNIHDRILHDNRSSTISLSKHRKLQQQMRARSKNSNRDLLTQALQIRTSVNQNRSGIMSVVDQAKSLNLFTATTTSNSSNDFVHTVKSFDQALVQTGSALKVLIMVGFKIKQVLRIDHVHLTFYSNFTLFVEWNDPRLVGTEDPNNINWNDDKYFDPKMIVINSTDVECYGNTKMLVDPLTGLVKQTLKLKGNLTIHETSFGAFPYDFQDLRIQVQSDKYPGHSVLLVSTGTSLVEHHPREEWSLSGLRTEVYTTNPHASNCGNSFSGMHIVIMVERDPAWYKRNILATLSLIWAAAMVTLFMPFSTYDALGYRMESCIALLLASVATKFTVTEHLPKVSVLTLCESHMNMCFLGILINIATSILLYVIEKYAHGNSLSESMSDEQRFQFRSNYYGGQACSFGTMVSAHVITVLTLLGFSAWHLRMYFQAAKYQRSREAWRTLALPESLDICGRPLPSILTQFNGIDTPVAKARDHLLSKFGNHLRHRVHRESEEHKETTDVHHRQQPSDDVINKYSFNR